MMKKTKTFLAALFVCSNMLNLNAQITDPSPYCDNSYDDWEGDGGGNGLTDFGIIDRVTLGTINNAGSGGAGESEYKYYNEMSTDLNAGSTYEIEIVAGDWGHVLVAWIDFNGDGDFDDASERLGYESVIGGGAFPKTRTISFTVPADAVEGDTRMRVRNAEWDEGDIITDEGDGPDACATYNSGETEDYNITIVGGGEGAGISEEIAASIVLYPNPATAQIILQGLALQEVVKTKIIGLNGAEYSCTFYQNTIDLNDFDSGIYILQLELSSGVMVRKRFTKL